MSALIKEVLATGNFGGLQTSALVIFISVMTIVTIWIFLPGSKAYYNRIASDITKGGQDE